MKFLLGKSKSKETFITVEGIDIEVIRGRRTKNINISIQPFKGVRISMPWFASVAQAKVVIERRMAWIKNNLAKMQRSENAITVFQWDSTFQTQDHKLNIQTADLESAKARISNGEILILIPQRSAIEDDDVQLFIRAIIEKTWAKEAKQYLPNRVHELALEFGFDYKKVGVRNSKTRWGSCSHDNNISLSLHLMRLPSYLIDHIILHELVHTKVKNHSSDFWEYLEKVSFNTKKLNKEITNYSLRHW